MDTPIGASTPPIATATIDLDASEFLTSVSGTILMLPGGITRGVASLVFKSNKQVYGPFGILTTDKPFEVIGPIYGFHGAVLRGDTADILYALGCWKLPAAKQATAADTLAVTG
jgi:hypothetical protein